MRGIQYVVDADGTKKAVVIDLTENAEIWEDFYDTIVSKEREGEPRETLEEVRERLAAQSTE